MNGPLIQLRYEIDHGVKPTRKQIEAYGREWIRTGKTPPGVRVIAKCWAKDAPKNLRAYLKKRNVYFGCPGVVKCYAHPTLTMCDYDNEEPPTFMKLAHIARTIGALPVWVEYDRTRRGWHMIVCWDRTFKPAEIVAIQAILGSDPARETFNMARVLSGGSRSKRWNLLFECKVL